MGDKFSMPVVEIDDDDQPTNAVKMDCVAAQDNAPILTLQRRHLAWMLAGAMALVGGGQTAVQFVAGDPRVDELTTKVDHLTRAVDQQARAVEQQGAELTRLRTEQETRQQRHDVIMQAILLYQIELDRGAREHGVKRSPELARAAARLQDLAERL